jgi:hypothetical protein
MSIDLDAFSLAEKSLAARPVWIIQDSEWLGFTCPIDIDDITLAGFRLRAKSKLRYQDRHVILQMEHHPPTDKGGAICRMEWKPFNGHNNRGLGPKEWRFREIVGSHHHPFHLNWEASEKAVRRGQLPIAIPLEPDPANFREFLALIGKEFRIKNIQCISAPPWQPLIV